MKKKLCRVLAALIIATLAALAMPVIVTSLAIVVAVGITFGIIWVFQQAFGDE